MGNVRRSAAFEHDRQIAKAGRPVDHSEWLMNVQLVNATYNAGRNEICIPAAILGPPMFDPDADPADNYGGIGSVIGHELGHAFDDQGARYDAAGNLHDWWTEQDRKGFQHRADQLIDQYNNFEPRALLGLRVNGSLTVGENIGRDQYGSDRLRTQLRRRADARRGRLDRSTAASCQLRPDLADEGAARTPAGVPGARPPRAAGVPGQRCP